DPQRSPDGKWVAYVVSRGIKDTDKNDSDIWMASWDGTQEIQLTFSAESESQPRWSPDNKYLSFVSSRQGPKDGQLWLLNRGGGEAVKASDVKGGIEEYAWSPDAKRLVFVVKDPDPRDPKDEDKDKDKEGDKKKTPPPLVIDRYHFKQDVDGYLRNARMHLYLFDVATKKAQAITSGILDEESSPVWSPDGTRIAFVSKRGTGDLDRTENTDVWVIDAKPGAEPRQVTTSPNEDSGPLSWSPDGKSIAYVVGEDLKYSAYNQNRLAVIPARRARSPDPAAGVGGRRHVAGVRRRRRPIAISGARDAGRQPSRAPSRRQARHRQSLGRPARRLVRRADLERHRASRSRRVGKREASPSVAPERRLDEGSAARDDRGVHGDEQRRHRSPRADRKARDVPRWREIPDAAADPRRPERRGRARLQFRARALRRQRLRRRRGELPREQRAGERLSEGDLRRLGRQGSGRPARCDGRSPEAALCGRGSARPRRRELRRNPHRLHDRHRRPLQGGDERRRQRAAALDVRRRRIHHAVRKRDRPAVEVTGPVDQDLVSVLPRG